MSMNPKLCKYFRLSHITSFITVKSLWYKIMCEAMNFVACIVSVLISASVKAVSLWPCQERSENLRAGVVSHRTENVLSWLVRPY